MAERGFSSRRLPGVATIAVLTFVILYATVGILVVNAFNGGTVIGRWEGVSLRWFIQALENRPFRAAAVNSLILATIVGLLATFCAMRAEVSR